MSRSNRPLVAVLVATVGVLLAVAVTRLAGFTSAVDVALPFWAALAGLAGAVASSDAAAQRIALAVPLVLAAAIAIPSGPARHFVYGLLLAGALTIAFVDVARDGEIARGRAIALALLVVATRAFPFDAGAIVPLAVLAVGAIALTAAVCHPERSEGSVALLPLFLVSALALVTPLAPWDAALVPVAIAMGLGFQGAERRSPFFVLRSPRLLGFVIATLLVALIVGRWMLVAVAIVIVSRVVASMRRTGDGPAQPVPTPAFAFPLTASRAGAAIAAAGFAPGAFLAAADGWQRVAAALLFALSLVARPQPALILGLFALLVLAAAERRRDDGRDGRAPWAVTGALLFCAVALSAWSGAAAAAFPLFVARELWVPFAVVCAIALLLPQPRIAALLGAAAFVGFIVLMPEEPLHVEPVGVAVAPGASFVLEPPLESRAIDVVISGANIAGLGEGSVLGNLDVIDAAGEAFARPIRAGDAADWGAFRSGDLFRTLNPLPRRPGWTIRGAGREAALHGEGRLRIRLDRPIGRMIVTAAIELPADARLQIERMEVAAP